MIDFCMETMFQSFVLKSHTHIIKTKICIYYDFVFCIDTKIGAQLVIGSRVDIIFFVVVIGSRVVGGSSSNSRQKSQQSLANNKMVAVVLVYIRFLFINKRAIE